MKKEKPRGIRRDWLVKSVAGTLLGLALAFGCSGLFVFFNPDMSASVRAQLAMWMVMPIWLGTLSAVFLFRNGWRAWIWLGGANLLVYGALIAAH
jgi:drug/metabolite transporter (DMT)-like permease